MITQLKGVLSGLLAVGAAATVQASSFVVGTWDFNTFDLDGTTGTPFTTDGNGQLDPVGNGWIEFGFTGGSSDSGPDNSAMLLVGPMDSQAGDQLGANFGISTLGVTDIEITFDFRRPPGSGLSLRFEYSIDNGNFWTEATTFGPAGDGSWSNGNLISLGSEFGVANNSNLRFRFVGELDSMLATDSVLLELDRIQVTGEPSAVPEPTAVVMGVGLAVLAAGRRLVRR